MRRILCQIILLMVCLCSHAQAMAARDSQLPFPLPVIPDTLRTPEQRTAYLILHYWDGADFKEGGVQLPDTVLEQAFSDYASVLPIGTHADVGKGVSLLMSKASQSRRLYVFFSSLAEKYLYDSESPVRNDSLFCMFLNHQLSSSFFSDTEKQRLRHQLESVRRNAPGTMASDFSYETVDGTKGTLHKTAEGVPMLLLLYDPDCDHCRDMLFNLRYNSVLNLRLRAGKIKVLAVYTEEDHDRWKGTAGDMPALWTVCTDRGMIKERDLYDVRTMPVLYLLDADKRVVLKNTSSKAVAEYLLSK